MPMLLWSTEAFLFNTASQPYVTKLFCSLPLQRLPTGNSIGYSGLTCVDHDKGDNADLWESDFGLPADAEQEPLHLQPARLCASDARHSAGASWAYDGTGQVDPPVDSRGLQGLQRPTHGWRWQVCLPASTFCCREITMGCLWWRERPPTSQDHPELWSWWCIICDQSVNQEIFKVAKIAISHY